MDDIYFYCFTVSSSWFWFCCSLLRLQAGISPGPMDLQHFPMWISRFLLVSIRQQGGPLPLPLSVFCFNYFFYLFSRCDLSLLSYCISQVNWQWLWVRWVVGNLLCCWRHWGRCSECRGQLPGTGQFCLCLNEPISHSETFIEHQVASYCGRVATILILMSPDYLKVFLWTEHSLQLTTSQGSFPVTVLYFPNHFNQIASWMKI